jgi:hypothetical protein
MIFLHQRLSIPSFYVGIPVLGAALIIASGPNALINKLLLTQRPIIYIGMLSYPLYLWHVPLLSFIHIQQPMEDKAYRVGAVVLSFLLASASYHFVEKKIRNIKEYIVIPYLATFFIAISMGAIAFINKNGFPDRYNVYSQNIIKDYESEAKKSFEKFWRAGSCFLMKETEDYRDLCLVQEGDMTILWGDSYAAHLYFGLNKEMNKVNKEISQLTALGCPPIFEFKPNNRDYCIKKNDFVKEQILKNKPKIIILSAGWFYYSDDPSFKTSLSNTLAWLKLHVPQIIVVGPVPFSHIDQVKYAIRDSESGLIPITFSPRNFDVLAQIDDSLRYSVELINGHYLSPISKYCFEARCELFVQSAQGDNRLSSFDKGHLTTSASCRS